MMHEITLLPIDKIRPNPFQPRETFEKEKILELAHSIEEFGLIQPIVVRKVGDTYQIIAGERRWRACQFVNLTNIPSVILEADDIQTMELSLMENLHRVNLQSKESETFISELYERDRRIG